MRVLLMSIKPPYSTRIMGGSKRFELRRGHVRVESGDVVVVYASAPVKAVVGAFRVERVVRDEPERLWDRHGSAFGIEEALYYEYFDGREIGHAIEVGDVLPVGPISLADLRERLSGFRPPQSYMRWRRDLVDLLGAEAAVVEDQLVAGAT